jgi:hypothetical protein
MTEEKLSALLKNASHLVIYANRSFPPGIGTAKALSVMATIT